MLWCPTVCNMSIWTTKIGLPHSPTLRTHERWICSETRSVLWCPTVCNMSKELLKIWTTKTGLPPPPRSHDRWICSETRSVLWCPTVCSMSKEPLKTQCYILLKSEVWFTIIMHPKDLEETANRVYTVCPDLSVQKLCIIVTVSSFEPCHKKTCLWGFATKYDSNWPAQLQR